MSWEIQLRIVGFAMLIASLTSLILRKRLAGKEDVGPFIPSNREVDTTTTWDAPLRPTMRGCLYPASTFLLYWVSLLTLNNHFRRKLDVHALYVDIYATIMVTLAFLGAIYMMGPGVWLIALWRILCLLVHILSVGIFRDQIRKMRGDYGQNFSPRIVLLGLVNWAELVALFAIVYQAIRGNGIWLYESFTTQATMAHSDRLRINDAISEDNRISGLEKLAVVSQISISLLLITTLVGMYVGSLNKPAGSNS
jgi:hypothetical protein